MRKIRGIKSVSIMAKKAGKVPPGYMVDMAIRQKFGSLTDFCNKYDLDYHRMYHFCKGQKTISINDFDKLGNVLGLDAGFLHETQRQFFRK